MREIHLPLDSLSTYKAIQFSIDQITKSKIIAINPSLLAISLSKYASLTNPLFTHLLVLFSAILISSFLPLFGVQFTHLLLLKKSENKV